MRKGSPGQAVFISVENRMAVKEKSDLSKKNMHFPRFLTQVLGTGAFALF